MALFLATQQSLHVPVDGHKFIDFWREWVSSSKREDFFQDRVPTYIEIISEEIPKYLAKNRLLAVVILGQKRGWK